jgi:CheY-like chemotaxis protein
MERLAADTDLALIPVIIVSGLDPWANRERALRGGAMAFVQKPWDQDKLLANHWPITRFSRAIYIST